MSKRVLGLSLVAFRTAKGNIAVMDARCSHLGAHLGCGRVVGESIQCPFHNWRYGTDGHCTHIPGAPAIPFFARQKCYPVEERHGYVSFFNGPEPLFPLPFFLDGDPDEFVAGKLFSYTADCSWYMNAAHAFDTQHFAAVHDRKLIAPPKIDCPAPYARRNSYTAEIVGDTIFDRLLRLLASRVVNITLTIWGGTFAVITGEFGRVHSGFLISMTPLENGQTLCEGIVLARRYPDPLRRALLSRLSLPVRRLFTYGYLADEARRLRGTRYQPTRLTENDQDMADFFLWVASLPQNAPQQPSPNKEGRNDENCSTPRADVRSRGIRTVGDRIASG